MGKPPPRPALNAATAGRATDAVTKPGKFGPILAKAAGSVVGEAAKCHWALSLSFPFNCTFRIKVRIFLADINLALSAAYVAAM